MFIVFIIFCFKQKTAYEMRISDWSSDVCSSDLLSNAASEKVANNVKGTLAIPHHYGRLQFGEDLELHFRTLIGTGSNPNVAAVVVIGIEQIGRASCRERVCPYV